MQTQHVPLYEQADIIPDTTKPTAMLLDSHSLSMDKRYLLIANHSIALSCVIPMPMALSVEYYASQDP